VNSLPAFQNSAPIVLPNEGNECRSAAYILHGISKQLTYITFSSKNIKEKFYTPHFRGRSKKAVIFADFGNLRN